MEQHSVLEVDLKARSAKIHVRMNTSTTIHSAGDYTKYLYHRI